MLSRHSTLKYGNYGIAHLTASDSNAIARPAGAWRWGHCLHQAWQGAAWFWQGPSIFEPLPDAKRSEHTNGGGATFQSSL
jgi:hypothetical protein